MSNVKAEPPVSIAEYVLDVISRWILERKIKPGERLSPSAIADQLDISHIPVREALRSLEAEGIVTNMRSKGFFLADITIADAEDIFKCRGFLESQAYSIGVPLLTDNDIENLRQLDSRMRIAFSNDDSYEFSRLNREFHFIPLNRSGSPRMIRFLNQLWNEASLYIAVHLSTHIRKTILEDQHAQLLEALEARDVKVVNDLMEIHREVTLDVIRSIPDSKSNVEKSYNDTK